MKLLNFTIIKLTLCLIIGIILASAFTVSLIFIFALTLGLLALLGLTLLIAKKQIDKTVWFGCSAFLTTICIGVLIVQLHDQQQFKAHYTQQFSKETISEGQIIFRIREILKPTTYHDKYVVSLLKFNGQTVTGKLLLNVSKDSTKNKFEVDDVLYISSPLETISSPQNPYQFNYRRYLEKQYIYHQITTKRSSIFKIQSETQTLFGYADRIRTNIDKRLKAYHFRPDELAIINALLLGQRKDISKEIFDNYSHAGAIHILAVSGLHVGIILLILNMVFKPVERLKHGRYIKIAMLLMCLWSFAIIAGMSASVTRAVAMFTVVAIGMNLKRPTNIFNTLAISMFILLLFKPMFLFDVGFQMSYLAVIAIVSIQPLFKKLWTPKHKTINYFWEIFTVTIAAQIGVLPISLYYFHQFPGLFFISNLVIIPFLGFILGVGIIVILLAVLNILPQFIADIYGGIISSMNHFIGWISQQESFLFKNISFGITFVIVSYVLVIALFTYFKKPKHLQLAFVLIAILCVQAALMIDKRQSQSDEIVVFHKTKHSLIGIKQNESLTVASSIDSIDKLNNTIIKNYMVGQSIDNINTAELRSVYSFANKKMLVIDSLGIYNVKSFLPDYVLLRNSPKINLKRLIDSLHPKLIIADGSNYRSYAKRWETTCRQQKIPFHLTSEKGAFILK